jgi:hypothetical protein
MRPQTSRADRVQGEDSLLRAYRTGPPPDGAMELFVCEHCGDVIGIYEPLVACAADGERTTSRAAEPELEAAAGAYYHRDCFTHARSPSPPA